MVSEKKSKYPTPDSVATGELKRASKENMNLVRYCSLYFFSVCVHLQKRRKLICPHLFYCVSLGHSACFLNLFIYANCLFFCRLSLIHSTNISGSGRTQPVIGRNDQCSEIAPHIKYWREQFVLGEPIGCVTCEPGLLDTASTMESSFQEWLLH